MNHRPSRDRRGRAPEQLISAIIPGPPCPTPPHPVPLAALPAPPPHSPSKAWPSPTIGTARVDRSGRFQHGRILDDLRWSPGDDLLLDIDTDHDAALLITPASHAHDGSALCRLQPTPRSRPRRHRRQIDPRGAITLPAAARSLCGIAVGSTIVLVADPAAQRLLILSAAVAARLLTEHQGAPPAAAPHVLGRNEEELRHEP